MLQRCLLVMVAATLVLGRPGLAEESPPEKGYRTLLNLPFGLPICSEEQYFELWKVWPEPLRTQAEEATPEQRQEMALRRYGFQLSPDRPGTIPQQFTPDGKGNLMTNCLACHGGPVRGQVVRGLGNGLSDMDSLVEDLQRQGLASPPPSVEGLIPTPPVAARGLNLAWWDATLFVALRDKDMQRVEQPVFNATTEQLDIPLRTPPFWWSSRKTRYYADGFVGKSSRDIMQFGLHPVIPAEEFLGWEEAYQDIFAWINSVKPPAYTRPIDSSLAAEGRILYVNHCSRCHGTYGPGGSYPEKLVSLEEVGTDPVRARYLSPEFKKHLGAGWLGHYGETPLSLEEGYLAPPLDGIWAVAPYLHNGSVPTIWHLLTPAERPAIWSRSDDGYDDTRLGLEIITHEALPPEATRPDQQRHYYQTRLRGLSNQGHEFPPAGLDEDEKAALIEYLKTL